MAQAVNLAGIEAITYYEFLAAAVGMYKPRHVLELGTGTGLSAKAMLSTLAEDSTLVTVNWPNPPSGDDVGCELREAYDHRLYQILGDTREYNTMLKVHRKCLPFDFVFIDSGTEHTDEQVSAEWKVWEQLFADRAIVCMDDLNANDMRRFWDALPYEKAVLDFHGPAGFGVFEYVRRK